MDSELCHWPTGQLTRHINNYLLSKISNGCFLPEESWTFHLASHALSIWWVMHFPSGESCTFILESHALSFWRVMHFSTGESCTFLLASHVLSIWWVMRFKMCRVTHLCLYALYYNIEIYMLLLCHYVWTNSSRLLFLKWFFKYSKHFRQELY